MSPSLEQAREIFLSGVAHFERGAYEAAHAAFSQALALAPGRASVLLNLGVTAVRLHRHAEAAPLLEQALAADATLGDGWAALGVAQMELGQWQQARPSLENAVRHGAGSASTHLRLGQCLVREGRAEEALAAFETSLALDADLAEAWTQLGHLRRDLQQPDEAARCYRSALARGGDAELHRYYLAALEPGGPVPNAPRHYVQGLFNQYADEFEGHLVGQLRYQGHRVLVEQLPAECPAQFAQVLDLGCGTGLCGAHVRPRAQALWGLDLSPAMLQQARERGIYDQLVEADVVEFLQRDGRAWDLVLAADVFIYVGPLDDVFAALASRVAAAGWLAFTIEEAADGGATDAPQLLPSLRYAHSLAYVQALAMRHGFRSVKAHRAPLRWDQQTPVLGQYLYLQKA